MATVPVSSSRRSAALIAGTACHTGTEGQKGQEGLEGQERLERVFLPIPPILPKLMPMAAVLVTRRLPSSVLDKLRAASAVDLYVGDEPISADELRSRLANKDALV